MRLNRRIWRMIALTAAVCLIAIFVEPRGREDRRACTVALVPRSGMAILSENPVRVKRGGTAAFQVRFDENCYPDEASEARYESGALYVDNVTESRSVHYAPRRQCSLAVRESDAEYVELLSGSPALSGETAQVRVNPPEHYIARRIRVNEDAYPVPSTGTLSFPVYEDSEISLELAGEPVDFSVTSRPIGTVLNLQEREEYGYGDAVTLRAEWDGASARFDGWSADAYLNGGGTPLSTEAELSFTLSQDISLFANFTDLHTYTVSIDPNGGHAEAALTIRDCSAGQPAYLPADTGALRREGCALIGYNTRADGGGRHFALASPVIVGQEDITLYAEWLPETPADALTYEVINGYAMVKGAARELGDALVIPATLDGMTVKGIDLNAFAGNAALKTVLIPLGVTHIGGGAFSNCPNLSTVYLPDTLEAMEGGAFEDCPAFEHLRVLSRTDARVYDNTFEAALADQYARLRNTEGKHIILVAGSSGSFGLNSNLLAKRCPDYAIINFSGSYQFGMLPMMFYVSNNIHQGDIVIFAPEYYGAMYANSLTSELANWMYLESDYNMLDELNLQVVRKSILNTYTAFLSERRTLLPGKRPLDGRAYARSAFNEYGDVAIQRAHRRDAEPYSPDPEIINPACVAAYSGAFDAIAEKGGACLFSFPPVSDGGAAIDTLRPAYDAFTQKLTEAFANLPCTVISSAADYIFPSEAFYDNRYHMTTEGAILRTNQLIADLDAHGLKG